MSLKEVCLHPTILRKVGDAENSAGRCGERESWKAIFCFYNVVVVVIVVCCICGRAVFSCEIIYLSLQQWQNFWDMEKIFTILGYITES
jgi:hypothetical protein